MYELNKKKIAGFLLHKNIQQKQLANFKSLIHNSRQSDNWFHFKMKRLEDHVKQIIYSEIHKMHKNLDDNELPF